jgi:hypothetical protein
MTVIGVTGYAQHGKDTIASVLVEDFGFKRVAFADALRQAVLTLDPMVSVDDHAGFSGFWRYSQLLEAVGYEDAKKNPEVRRLLQVMGTEVARDLLGEDVWVQAWQRAVDGIGADVEGIVVPDVRFPNEADHIISLGGSIWEVYRPDFDNGLGTDHPSEAFIDSLPTSKMLFNIGTVEELKQLVYSAMGRMEVSG